MAWNGPGGGEAWPAPLAPQQTAEPSVCKPHVWPPPAVRAPDELVEGAEEPSGTSTAACLVPGRAAPSAIAVPGSPQQTTAKAQVMAIKPRRYPSAAMPPPATPDRAPTGTLDASYPAHHPIVALTHVHRPELRRA
jgi:hypothetical protein